MADVIEYTPEQGKLLDWMGEARLNGYSRDDIVQSIQGWTGQARTAGYSEDEINKALGFTDGSSLEGTLTTATNENAKAATTAADGTAKPVDPNASPLDVFYNHMRNSSSGLLMAGGKYEAPKVDPDHENWLQHFAGAVGDVVGDLPSMAVGGLVGAKLLGPIGGGAGAFGLPTFIKAAYADAFMHGDIKGPQDFIDRYGKVMLETGKAAAVGAGFGAVSKLAGVAGLSTFDTTLAQLSALTAVPAALNGRLPETMDIVDAAVILVGFKAIGEAGLPAAREALTRLWRDTGIGPKEAAVRMQADEGFRQKVVSMMADLPNRVVETTKDFAKDESGAGAAPQPPPAPTNAHEEVASHFEEPVKPADVKTEFTAAEAYRQYLNRESPVVKVLDAARSGGSITDGDNPQILLRAAANSDTHAKYVIEKGQLELNSATAEWTTTGGKSLSDILKPFKNETGPDNFWTYAGSRWAQERAAQGIETGIPLPAADEVVRTGGAKYERAFQEFQEFQNSSLKVLNDAGIVSDEGYQQIIDDNKARIPGMRVGKKDIPSGKGSTVANPVKSAYGSDLNVRNTLQTTMQETFFRFKMAERNLAKAAMYKAAEGVQMAERVVTPATKIKLTEKELAGLQSDLLNDPTFDTDSAAIWRRFGTGDLKPNEDAFFEDGKLVKVAYDDPHIAQFMRGLDTPTSSMIGKIGAKFHSFLRKSITSMPDFPLRMAIWDKQLSFMTDPEWRLGGAGFFEGLAHTITKDATYDAFNRSGGFGRIFDDLQRDPYIQAKLTQNGYASDVSIGRKVWNAIKSPIKALEWWSNGVMRAQQVGRFARELKGGTSPIMAGQVAQEAAFPRPGGGGSSARVLDRNLIFVNAYLQSLEVMARAATGFGSNTKGLSYSPAKFYAAGFLTITVPTLLQWWLNKDKPWYQSMSPWEKDNSYLAHTGPDDAGTTWTLHTLPIASFLFGGIPRRIAEAMYKQDPSAMTDELGKSFAWSFVPPGMGLITNLASPVLAKLSNYDFGTGAPVTPNWMKDQLLPPEQFTPYSSQFARWLSTQLQMVPVLKSLQMNPNEIDLFMLSWTGPLVANAERGAETVLRAQGLISEDAAAMQWSDLPGFRTFVARYPESSSYPVDKFNDQIKEYTRAFGSMKAAMEAGDFNRFKELALKNPTFTAMTKIDLGNIGGLEAASLPDLPRYLDVFNQVANKVDVESLQGIMIAKKSLEEAKTVARIVELTETPETRQILEGLVGTGKTGKLTADDKRQLLDRIYIGMLNVANYGNTAIRRSESTPLTP